MEPPGLCVSDGVVITRQEAGQEVISLIISLYREQLSKTLPPAAPDIGHLASFLVEYVNCCSWQNIGFG